MRKHSKILLVAGALVIGLAASPYLFARDGQHQGMMGGGMMGQGGMMQDGGMMGGMMGTMMNMMGRMGGMMGQNGMMEECMQMMQGMDGTARPNEQWKAPSTPGEKN